jgi:tRNA-specific 2-thiouridylase
MEKKALIAMSGGVDSSVAAYLMKEQGYACMGATMKLVTNPQEDVHRERSCCSLEDVEDARSVAARLDIPYYVFNFTEDFREQVVKPFISAYEKGETPNPCIDCNRHLKFERFYQRAMELGCDYVVTGHYVRIAMENGRYLLKKAVDQTKDQSYVLYAMTQEQLAHALFPLGEMEKVETRRLAEREGFLNSEKPDSQDICFVPDGDYAGFIRRTTGKEYAPGPFVDMQGRVLGQHRGIIHYTRGQRKGLGISAAEPLYVCRICPEENQIVVGSNEDLFSREFEAEQMNWIYWENPPETFRAKVKVRYRHKEQWANVQVLPHGRIHVVFDEAQRAITPGQAAVLYQGETVLGGGVIQ